MDGAIEFFLSQGSYGLMVGWILLASFGAPLPEDVPMISGGILAQRGVTDLTTTLVVLAVSVLVGDTIFFFLMRRLGLSLYEKPWMKKAVTAERRAQIETAIARWGSLVVFGARHVAGLRAVVFAMSAIHGISYVRFLIADAIALAVSLPVFFGIGWTFSNSLGELASGTSTARTYLLLGIGAIVLFVGAVHLVRGIQKRRRERAEAKS